MKITNTDENNDKITYLTRSAYSFKFKKRFPASFLGAG